MNRRIVIDEENPEWTDERVKGAMRFKDLPAEVRRAWESVKERTQATASKRQKRYAGQVIPHP